MSEGAASPAGATSELTLYSYWRSSCSWRVRIALALKGLHYRYVPVHLVRGGGEQHKADYRALNPVGHVPALLDGDLVLSESLPIIEYLDEKFPEPRLVPEDRYQRFEARRLAETINAGIQPVQNLKVLQYVTDTLGRSDADKVAWGAHWIAGGFVSLERLLSRTAGTYSIGDTVTLPDLFVVPQVYNAKRFGVDMTAFPTIARIDAALSELPAFKAAHPDVQPDAPA